MSRKDLAILGFEPDFDYVSQMDLIRKRFKKLALEYHPDKGTGNIDKFKMLENAYHNIMSRAIQCKGKEIEKEEGEDCGEGSGDGSGGSGGSGSKIGHVSKSDLMKRRSYGSYEAYFNCDNYFKKYCIADENTYRPFVLFFNISVAVYLKSKNVCFEQIEKSSSDELFSYTYMYESIVDKWNLLSRRKKRIYRGIVRTIDTISNEPQS